MTKNQIKIWVGFLVLILIIGCTEEQSVVETEDVVEIKGENVSLQEPQAVSSLSLNLFVSPIEIVNNEKFADVILTVESGSDVENVSGEIILPVGLELVEGSLGWEADLQKEKPKKFNLKLKSVKDGDWTIEAWSGNTFVLAEVSTRVGHSGEIYINESEFYKGGVRSYHTGYPTGTFEPDLSVTGFAINEYFKGLNLTEEYIYVMMQFNALGGDPTPEQIDILAKDNLTLFRYHGDHTYRAKAPKIILETKSYDFVRWVGIVEDHSVKLNGGLKGYAERNCTGEIKLEIAFYENLKDEQFRIIKEVSSGCLVGYNLNCNSTSNDDIIDIETDINMLEEIASLNFVKTIGVVPVMSILGGPGGFMPPTDPFANVTCN